jgi:hypothetical protein
MKFINVFLFLWVIFVLLDPGPDCESGYGSRDPIESGSNPDTDPQHICVIFSRFVGDLVDFVEYSVHK